ncbi:hypothetical protein E2542_SST00397 [Spatholobus suberectus]|nr:hypothetical protein E2542_SST00397 [Spatholobus suberectus]
MRLRNHHHTPIPRALSPLHYDPRHLRHDTKVASTLSQSPKPESPSSPQDLELPWIHRSKPPHTSSLANSQIEITVLRCRHGAGSLESLSRRLLSPPSYESSPVDLRNFCRDRNEEAEGVYPFPMNNKLGDGPAHHHGSLEKWGGGDERLRWEYSPFPYGHGSGPLP